MANAVFRTFKQQLDVLSKDPLIRYDGNDQTIALNIIKTIGYESIIKYIDCFKTHLSFNDIYKIYLFDSVLKSESLRLIGLVERYVKTVISNTFISNHEFNSYCYTNKNNFAQANKYEKFYKGKIKQKNNKGILPLWNIFETMCLGDLIQMYEYMFDKDKQDISKVFNKNINQFSKELFLMKRIRNISAHFDELLNRIDFNNLVNQENRITKFFKIIVSWIPDMDEWNKFILAISKAFIDINNVDVKLKILKLFTFKIKIN